MKTARGEILQLQDALNELSSAINSLIVAVIDHDVSKIRAALRVLAGFTGGCGEIGIGRFPYGVEELADLLEEDDDDTEM